MFYWGQLTKRKISYVKVLKPTKLFRILPVGYETASEINLIKFDDKVANLAKKNVALVVKNRDKLLKSSTLFINEGKKYINDHANDNNMNLKAKVLLFFAGLAITSGALAESPNVEHVKGQVEKHDVMKKSNKSFKIAIEDGVMYLYNNSGAIWKMPRFNGRFVEMCSVTNLPNDFKPYNIVDITVEDSVLYLYNDDDKTLWEMPRFTGPLTKVCKLENLSEDFYKSKISSIAIEDSVLYLYSNDSGTIWKMPRFNGKPTIINNVGDLPNNITDVTIEDGVLYLYGNDKILWKLPRFTGPVREVCKLKNPAQNFAKFNVDTIAMEDSVLYLYNSDSGTIWKMPRFNGKPEKIPGIIDPSSEFYKTYFAKKSELATNK